MACKIRNWAGPTPNWAGGQTAMRAPHLKDGSETIRLKTRKKKKQAVKSKGIKGST